jgi:hypothetical protein
MYNKPCVNLKNQARVINLQNFALSLTNEHSLKSNLKPMAFELKACTEPIVQSRVYLQ